MFLVAPNFMRKPSPLPLLRLLVTVGVLLFSGASFAHKLNLVCSSQGKSLNRCALPRSGKVTLVKQLSLATCKHGKSWGYDRNSVWVKRGCRARFKIGHSHDPNEIIPVKPNSKVKAISRRSPSVRKNNNEVYCASPYRRNHKCKIKIRGKVRLIHEFSSHACHFGKSWGFNRKGIWVNKGCTGLFRILPFPTAIQSQSIRCESYELSRRYCKAPFPGDVQLAVNLAHTDCIPETDWGYDKKGIWVNNGCSAKFKVFHRGNPNQIPGWLLGNFVGRDKGNRLKLFVAIHPYGISKAKINDTYVYAELNGDILGLNGVSYVIKKVDNGFMAVNTVRGRHHSILFKRTAILRRD